MEEHVWELCGRCHLVTPNALSGKHIPCVDELGHRWSHLSMYRSPPPPRGPTTVVSVMVAADVFEKLKDLVPVLDSQGKLGSTDHIKIFVSRSLPAGAIVPLDAQGVPIAVRRDGSPV